MKRYILALDAGTTSVRAMLFDVIQKKFVFTSQSEVGQSFPHDGWVEQNAEDIFAKCNDVIQRCICHVGADRILGIGITNQRETIVMWERSTGKPIAPAIVWQCRRTSDFCASIPLEIKKYIKDVTGLPTDAYFSASKIKWLLENVPQAKELMRNRNLCAGTVDTYLIFRVTGGRSFVTDHTNASRTMLFDIHKLQWDKKLLQYFGVPMEILPQALPCDSIMGEAELGGVRIPIAGVLGDQQAALFGQGCLREGEAKITYGTGLFLLFHTGTQCVPSANGLITTIGYSIDDQIYYALEGSVFHAGSCIQWLRDSLGLLASSAESETIAESVADSGGVSFIPAFTGLGAPHWNSSVRGALCGLTRGTTKAHIVRAVLESIAYSARELTECMQQDSGIVLKEIRCDGGASANNFLMQYQANVLNIPVDRPEEKESTALGVALMCAHSLGIYSNEEIRQIRKSENYFIPNENQKIAEGEFHRYQAVLKGVLGIN